MGLDEMDDLLKENMGKMDAANKEEKPTNSFNYNQAKEFSSKKNDIVITWIQGSGEIFLVKIFLAKSLHLCKAASKISSWLGWARVPETNT